MLAAALAFALGSTFTAAAAASPTGIRYEWRVAGSTTPSVTSIAHSSSLSRPGGVFRLPAGFKPRPVWSYWYYSALPFTKTDLYHQPPLWVDHIVIEDALKHSYGAYITRNGNYVQYNGQGGWGETLVCFEIGGEIQRPPGRATALYITHRFANPSRPHCKPIKRIL